MSWSRGDAAASRHDGRTGGAIGGGGPSPAVSRAALFELFQQTRGAILEAETATPVQEMERQALASIYKDDFVCFGYSTYSLEEKRGGLPAPTGA